MIHKKTIHYLILFLTLTAFTCVNSFSSSKSKPEKESLKNINTISIWHTLSSYNKEVLKNIVKNYKSDTEVKTVFYSNDKDIVLNLLKGESLPDVVIISTQYLKILYQKNLLADITDKISGKLYEDIDERFWLPEKIDNRIVAYPFMFDVFTLFVNQNIMWNSGLRDYQEPFNWDDIVRYAEKIKYVNSNNWGFFVPLENIEEFATFVESFSGKSIFTEGKITVNSEGAIEALEFLQSSVYEKHLMPPKITLNEAHTIFLSGKLGIMMSLGSELVYITSNFPYNLDLWKIPTLKKGHSYIKSNCLAIIKNQNRKKLDKIFDFILFLTNKENSIKLFTHTGIPPLKRSIKDSLELLIFYENNPNYSIPMLEVNRGKVFPNIPNYDEINSIIKKSMEEIMINGESPRKSLTKAQEKIDRIAGDLSKY